jgi:hypothetical protein
MRSAAHFRERALHEALRYGSDPLVLVRELLQNARDAGATRVAFETAAAGGTVRLSCRDDGLGLTFDEAERDLFTLYSSRKTRADAGRFGVGFWSVLLFEPTRLVVRSWPRRGAAWEAEWDGELEQARARRPPPAPRGTEVVLERAGDADPADSVFDAAWRHARFLRRRDGRTPLEVTVNGRRVSAELALPAPSLQFRRRGLRGVVGLADRPRVELYAKGLLVRTGATLDDLLAPGVRAHAAATASALPGSAAHFVLDADELDLLLSRGDARSDEALARVVAAAREELSRLLDRQLARAGAALPGRGRWRAAATGTALAAAAAMAALAFARPGADAAVDVRPRTLQASGPAGLPGDAGARAPAAPPAVRAYRDPRRTYEGPVLDRADTPLERIALRYAPPLTLHLATMRVTSFGPDGRPQVARDPIGPYSGTACTRGCVAIRMTAAGGAWTSLPLPTGHRLDPGSVTVGGAPARASAAADGTPLVRLPEGAVEVAYSTGPADEPAAPPTPVALPAALQSVARHLRSLPPASRPAAAAAWVRAHVRDARAGETPGRDLEPARDGADFAETALARGVGDCDVQNGIVSRLLQATGVPARLAIGYVGVSGSAAAGLHAWVEHRAGGGPWRVEDASGSAPQDAATAALPPAAAVPPARAPVRWWPLAAAGAAAAAAHALWARRTRRTLLLSDGLDVGALVRGALRHPERVAHAAALFHRALVPCRGGALSLSRAQELADGGALYVARRQTPLSTRAARQGACVVDGSQAAGRAAADALGAVDLDAWSERLDASDDGGPLLSRVNRGLREAGARFRVRAGAGVGAPCVLDLPRSRDVLLDAATPWLVEAFGRAEGRPAAAALDVAERAAELVALPPAEQGALLAPFARAALRESAP